MNLSPARVSTNEVLSRLNNVINHGKGQFSASCPCPNHGNGNGDKHQSLSIKQCDDGRTVIHCQAGCNYKDVLSAIGLSATDIAPSKHQNYKVSFDYNNIAATYDYGNGSRKLRDINKNFTWQHLENGQWVKGKGNTPHTLYKKGREQQTVYIVEGEKDADNLSSLGFYVVSGEHGAEKNGKWYAEYCEQLNGKDIRIIPDNDVVGIQFVYDSVIPSIVSVVKSLKVFDLTNVYPSLPIKGDISDLIEQEGSDQVKKYLRQLEETTNEYEPDTVIFDAKTLPALLNSLHPHSNERYRWTDLGNGHLFSDVFQKCLVFVPEKKAWFYYTGKHWAQDTGSVHAKELCKLLADALNAYALTIDDERQRQDYLKHCNKWQGRQYRETVLSDASSVRTYSYASFDKDPWIFNCQNGTLNLRTKVFRQHRSMDMITKLAGVYYDPNAHCNRWESFIGEIMCNDTEKATFLQKSLGYSLTGYTAEECFFILYGATSRNGKGTLMETFRSLMGDYGRAATPETITKKATANGSAPNEDVARLAGARFINISEPDRSMVLSSALIKTLTGNDTITASYKFENFFEFKMVGKIFINTNHLPQITDPTVFSSDRIKVIPFLKHFSEDERDTSLKGLFTERNNLSAVLNWCLEGLQLYLSDGLKIPASVREATQKYKHDSDKVSRFIEEMLEPEYGIRTRASDVFKEYQRFCVVNNFKESSSRTFNNDLESHGIELTRQRPSDGSAMTTVIVGYRLKSKEYQKVDVETPFD